MAADGWACSIAKILNEDGCLVVLFEWDMNHDLSCHWRAFGGIRKRVGDDLQKNSGSHKYLWTKLMCGVYERALAILIFAALNDARSDALATIVMSIRLVIR